MSFKVCVCGGAGGIGQPLALLMAMNPKAHSQRQAEDTANAKPKPRCSGYAIDPAQPAADQLADCLTGCHLVLIPAGVPRKPGMTRDDLFKINAGIAKGLVEACAQHCPNAVLGLIVNPVNTIVPAMCEIWKAKGLDPRKIVGITTLDCVRANKFVAEITGKPVDQIEVPVVGGHAGITICPLFSQDPIASQIPADQIPALDKHVQDAGTDVVNAKGGKGSATLSMAYAGARLASAVLSGLSGEPSTQCAYVMSDITDLPYFTSKVTFGANGVETVHPLGELNEYEKGRLAEASAALKEEIDKGLEYARQV